MQRTRSSTRLAVSALPLLALCSALPALAGSATVVSADGNSMTFEYSDRDQMRMGVSDESYMLVRDDTLYIVAYENGNPMVINASSMIKGFAGMMDQAAPSMATNEFVSLKKTGRSETVAGIKGEVYLLTVIEDGSERTDEIVMSGDARAIEFRDALFAMARSVSKSLDNPEAEKNSRELEGKLRETGLGVLRVGDEMKVTSISGDAIASARFALPAEPMDMQGLGAMMGSMGANSAGDDGGDAGDGKKSGGLFSSMMGAFGGQAERQQERVGNRVEDEIDEAEQEVNEETDSAVDKALDKAFGKLFGRKD